MALGFFTPEESGDGQVGQYRRKLIEALMQQGQDTSPILSPWQGVARMSNSAIAGFLAGRADKQDREGQSKVSDALSGVSANLFGGGAPQTVPQALGSGEGKSATPPVEIAPLIEKVATETGVPSNVLTAQIAQESAFDPKARGKAGEIGLGQILPSTARDPGFGMKGVDPNALWDPETNLRFSAQYLKARGGGDLSSPNKVAAALANYNGGGDPNYVQNVTRRMAPGQPTQVAQAGGMVGLGQAGGPAQPNQSLAAQKQLLDVIGNKYATKEQRAQAQAMLGMLQKDESVSTVDLGTSIGVMNKKGDIVRTIPKIKDAADQEYKLKQGKRLDQEIAAGAADPENKLLAREENVRKEVSNLPSYKNFAQAAPIYQSMAKTAGTNSKASDLNLVYGLGKIMDPGSVVREGEMIMVKNAAGLSEQVLGYINALNGGQSLTPETRKAIMAEAYGRLQSYQDQYNQDAHFYRGIAQRGKMNEANIIPNFGEFKPWEPPAAAPAQTAAPAPAPAPAADGWVTLPSGRRVREVK